MPKYTIQEEVGINSTGVEPVDLKVKLLPDNHLVCLQCVCVSNENKANSYAHIGVIIGGQIMWIDTQTMVTAGKYYSWNGEVFFKSCKTIILRFYDTDAGDNLHGYIYGYYLD